MAPAANNDDKEIETSFVTFGLQYMFNDKWGAQLDVPFASRRFQKDDGTGSIVTHDWSQLGDIRLEGIYTGFFADLSAGVTFGLKLPTGSYTENPDLVTANADRHGQHGHFVGGFYRGNLAPNQRWDWFAQLQLDAPVLTQAGYVRAPNWTWRRELITKDSRLVG